MTFKTANMNKTEITKDLEMRKLRITRSFAAPIEKVWRAWTEKEILDQWWAPRPWKAKTKTLDFVFGGQWLYCMAGPEGEASWCRVDFTAITQGKSFGATVNFCDENGNINADFPPMHWIVQFEKAGEGTDIVVEVTFDKDADLKMIVEMGFEAGFTMALGNLDEVLAS
jgi:uncharacterized protein YndB with AHSA1/START domain